MSCSGLLLHSHKKVHTPGHVMSIRVLVHVTLQQLHDNKLVI